MASYIYLTVKKRHRGIREIFHNNSINPRTGAPAYDTVDSVVWNPRTFLSFLFNLLRIRAAVNAQDGDSIDIK